MLGTADPYSIPKSHPCTKEWGVSNLLDDTHWAVNEFADAELGDVRRTQRLVELAGVLAQHPTRRVPHRRAKNTSPSQVTGPETAMKGYRRSPCLRRGTGPSEPLPEALRPRRVLPPPRSGVPALRTDRLKELLRQGQPVQCEGPFLQSATCCLHAGHPDLGRRLRYGAGALDVVGL